MNNILAFATLIATAFTTQASNNITPTAADMASTEAIHAERQITTTSIFEQPLTEALIEIEEQPEIDFAAQVAEDITEYAAQFLGRKYVWGATGPKNFDCSGFTSYVFRKQGIELHRTSRAQYTQGEKVDRDDLQPGDLMFFSSPRSGKGKVGHVAIVVDVDENTNQVTFIHASTKKGITYQKFPDGGYYSRNYIGAKRVISDNTDA